MPGQSSTGKAGPTPADLNERGPTWKYSAQHPEGACVLCEQWVRFFSWKLQVQCSLKWNFYYLTYFIRITHKRRHLPTKTTSLYFSFICRRYGVTSSYVGTSAVSYWSLFLHSYMDLFVFLSFLLRRKLLLKPAVNRKKKYF